MAPECFSMLLPAKPEVNFKYQMEGASNLAGAGQVQALTELFRKKPTPDEVAELLEQLPNPLKGILTIISQSYIFERFFQFLIDLRKL